MSSIEQRIREELAKPGVIEQFCERISTIIASELTNRINVISNELKTTHDVRLEVGHYLPTEYDAAVIFLKTRALERAVYASYVDETSPNAYNIISRRVMNMKGKLAKIYALKYQNLYYLFCAEDSNVEHSKPLPILNYPKFQAFFKLMEENVIVDREVGTLSENDDPTEELDDPTEHSSDSD